MRTLFVCIVMFLLFSATALLRAGAVDDAAFVRLADEFNTGYLAWRPLAATQLGVHDWDGRLTDLSPASIQREVTRLKEYQATLAAWDPASLSLHNNYDRRILLAAMQVELFWLDDARGYSRDPRRYIPDISVYITQSFAPLEERLKHVIAIENALGETVAVARANLDDRLPRPVVETAIRDARGAADFFAKDAVEAFRSTSITRSASCNCSSCARTVASRKVRPSLCAGSTTKSSTTERRRSGCCARCC
jgi:hypothetical protein